MPHSNSARKKNLLKKHGLKGVDISKLTKSQQNAMKKHSKHHTKKHIQYMYNSMRRGASFNKAHVNAQKKVGK